LRDVLEKVTGKTWRTNREEMLVGYCMMVSESNEAMALWLMKFHGGWSVEISKKRKLGEMEGCRDWLDNKCRTLRMARAEQDILDMFEIGCLIRDKVFGRS